MIIIYARGAILEASINKIDWNNVAAIADKTASVNEKFNDVPVILPEEISKYEYDAIVVFSGKYYDEICRSLRYEYNIPLYKIIDYKSFFGEIIYNPYNNVDTEGYLDIVSEYSECNILDTQESLLPNVVFSLSSLEGSIDCLSGSIQNNEHFYQHKFSLNDDIPKKYNLAIVWGETIKCDDIVSKCISVSENILYVQKEYTEDVFAAMNQYDDLFASARFYKGIGYRFWLIDTREYSKNIKSKCYVVSHKSFSVPNDGFYTPICVGGYKSSEKSLTDDKGDNISYLNNKINELTALYWIWKNSDAESIGLCHYRRYFSDEGIASDENILTQTSAERFLENYDIILPMEERFERTIGEQIQIGIDPIVYQTGYEHVRRSIEKNQPTYLDAFDSVWNRYSFYPCNMFYARKEVVDRFCNWLFSFITEAAEKMNIEGLNSQDQRVIGFIAERMLTVWLSKERLKIKKLRIIEIK